MAELVARQCTAHPWIGHRAWDTDFAASVVRDIQSNATSVDSPTGRAPDRGHAAGTHDRGVLEVAVLLPDADPADVRRAAPTVRALPRPVLAARVAGAGRRLEGRAAATRPDPHRRAGDRSLRLPSAHAECLLRELVDPWEQRSAEVAHYWIDHRRRRHGRRAWAGATVRAH